MITKMDRENRAKQFAPFSALKGLEELIHEQEKVYVIKRDLSEESQKELNRKLCLLQPGDFVSVEYYRNGAYHTMIGTVEKINSSGKFLIINETKIEFDRLYDISI